MTVYWGDASAPDYADNSDVLFSSNIDLDQCLCAKRYITWSQEFSVNLTPPFVLITAAVSHTSEDGYWRVLTDDGFYVRFGYDDDEIFFSINGGVGAISSVYPVGPSRGHPWFKLMHVLEDRVVQKAKTTDGCYTIARDSGLSGKVFTTLRLEVVRYEYRLNIFALPDRILHWPDVNFSVGVDSWSPNLFLEDLLYPQTRRYWLFSGYVTEGGSPVQNDVYIIDHRTGMKERLRSRPLDGYWEYKILRYHQQLRTSGFLKKEITSGEMDKRFAVFCHDPDQVYNAKIYDHLTPVLVEVED